MGRRGELRVYLGAAPGVGKTFAMLGEGRRRRDRGADVVVGFVETHGRRATAERIGDLEVVPRRTLEHRGATFEEMDIDAVLERRPQVALVDELAHTNVPGSRNEKRWQDVEELLAAGINVVSTVNIQHLESLNDVVERITGIVQRETIPDEVVRAADQVELVDMTPEALRRRMAHGNIYAPEKIDAALGNYFRPGNLTALRELALLWVADQVDAALDDYRARHGIKSPWETRERVIVAITGAPESEQLIRRAARIAQRTHGELFGVHVRTDTGLAEMPSERIAHYRKLLEELGGEFREVTGSDIAAALIDLARSENATQIVLGATRRSRWQEWTQGSVINRVIRLSGPIDVHVISADESEERPTAPRLPVPRFVLSPLPRRRQAIGWVVAALGLPLQTLVLAQLRDELGLPSVLLLYLVFVVGVAAIGGVFPALAAAVAASLLVNYFFTPPIYRFTINEAENILALCIFLLLGAIVSVFVDRVGRSKAETAHARAEAEAMAALAGSLAEPEVLPQLVSHLRDTFGMQAVALLRRDDPGWYVEADAGADVPTAPEVADVVKEIGNDLVLVMRGLPLVGDDLRVLNALAGQLATAVETRRLHGEAARATSLAQANDLRAALLQAVSHDLRTPLASIKASISSVRQHDVDWSADELREFHATIEQETDRLDGLVANLLDMSRIQAGALVARIRPVGMDEVVPAAVASLGSRGKDVVVEVPELLLAAAADAALLERAIANLIDNAVAVSPPGKPVRIQAGAIAGRIDTRVIDQGPGIPREERERVFQPFQRLVDHGTGVGLGLAIARGFVEAMGGDLTLEDTPGGGITMVVSLPEAV